MVASVVCVGPPPKGECAECEDSKADADSEHKLFWRRQSVRLEAELIRDAMLAVSGQLDTRMYGPGTLDEGMNRRSIYFTVKRSQLIPMMMVLDWPEPLVSIGARPTTTIAPQALLFMNSPQARKYAEGFARRLAGKSTASSVRKHAAPLRVIKVITAWR